MPRVNKLRKNTAKSKREVSESSIFSQVTSVGDVPDRGIKLNLYGRNGTGKTTLACTFPKPLLLVGFEDGTRSVRRVEGVDFIYLKSTEHIRELTEGAVEQGYKTLVLDTATSLQDLILCEIMKWDDQPVQMSFGTVSRNQYRQRAEKTKEILRLFLELPINVIVLAQEKNHTNLDEESSDSDVIAPFIASALGASTTGWLQDCCDFICQTFTRERSEVKKTKVGDKEISTSVKTGQIEFCLRTQRGNPTYAAKIRADRNENIPDFIVDPTYEKLAKYL